MKKILFKYFLFLLVFNLASCDKIKKIKSNFSSKSGPDVVVKKYFNNLITYDDSNTNSNNKIDEIIDNYIDVEKLQENSIRLAAEYAKLTGKEVSKEEIENAISQYKSLGKDFKETTIKLGLQTNSKAFKNRLAGRPFYIDIKGVKYLDNNKADVSYVVKTDNNEALTSEHAILEKIDNKWKIISYTLPDELPDNSSIGDSVKKPNNPNNNVNPPMNNSPIKK